MPLRRFTAAEARAGRRALEVPLFLTVFLSAAMFSLAEGSLVFLLIAWVAVVVHMIAAERNVELYAHRVVLNTGVVLVGVILTVRYLTTRQDLLIALGHYVTLIQLCKLFERKRDRDYLQMIVMSLLLVLAAAMVCQELLFALLGLVYLGTLTYTAIVFTMKRHLLAAIRQGREGADAAPADRSLRKAYPTRAVASRGIVALLAALATGAMVFVASPRSLGNSGTPLRPVRRPAEAGFAETVRLGEPRSIYLSDRVMMHMRMLAPDGTNLGHAGKPYLRGRVFTEYVDSRWARPRTLRRYLGTPPPARILGRAVRQEVSMMPSLLPVVFASHPAVKVVSADASVRRLTHLEYELKASARLERPVRYTAYVLADPTSEAERSYLGRLARRSGLGVLRPEQRVDVTEAVSTLARRWCADLLARRSSAIRQEEVDDLDLAIARRIADRLRQRCTYTLDLTDADVTRDGVDDFLFHLRRGHCEYFASATTVMCQVLGVRARLATGFCPSEFDDVEGHYVVRQRDAHAWTEVYTRKTDWVVVDATPADRFEPPEGEGLGGWWSGARDLWHEWEFAWYSRVIGYDDDARRQLAYRWRGYASQAWSAVAAAVQDVYWGLIDLFAKGRISSAVVNFFLAVGLIAAGIAVVLVVPRRRSRRRRRRGAAPKPPAFLVQLLALLRRHGLDEDPHRTARELADRAAAELRLPAETLHELIGLYYRIRWAGAPADRETLHAAEARVRELAEALTRRETPAAT